MDRITSLDKFRVPIGNQEIEIQEVAFEAGGTPMLRLRIREHSRFTIFDIDPVTAARWGQIMARWSQNLLAEPADGTAGPESQPDQHGVSSPTADLPPT